MPLLYLDSSALVKLIREERETAALQALVRGADLMSCALVLTELPRAIRRAVLADPRLPLGRLITQAEKLIDALALIPLDEALLAVAGSLEAPTLRSLDAIHIAAAASVLPIDAFVSYDSRQNVAARAAGLPAVAPGM